MRVSRLVWPICLAAAALCPALPLAQAPSECVVGGTITSGSIPLPGVVVSLTGADGQPIDVSSSGADGSYVLRMRRSPEGSRSNGSERPNGSEREALAERYVLKAELVAFATVTRELTVANCQQRVDLTMTLASRAPKAEGTAAPAAPAPLAARSTGGRGRGAAPAQPFQSLELVADQAGLARPDDTGGAAANGGDIAAQLLLPPGFSSDSSAESVTAVGTSSQANQFFFGPNGPGDFAGRFGGDGFGGGDAAGDGQAAPGGRGGPGGGRGGPGGPGGRGFGGGPFGGRGGRGRGNQIRGSIVQSFDTSALDAAPYALNGQATTKPDYLQQRFAATVGGPLTIPKVIDSPRTFFFLNYTGNHARNPYDQYSTVPTKEERSGDLSVIGGPVIPASQINPAAQRLLDLYPLPNQSGATNNFHNVTTLSNQLDDINLRLVRQFGAAAQNGRGRGGFGGGGRGGGGRGQPGVSNLNVTIHYRRSDGDSANPLPALGGSSTLSAWDTPVNYSFTKGGLTHSVRFDFNRQQSHTQNLFAGAQNFAGAAGLLGVSPDPFDWGAPNLSFSSFQSIRDVTPSLVTNRTISVGDTITRVLSQHTIRFGGDYRSIHADSRTDANARGSYVFTGLYSGSDFGDFLLGEPQQASVQFGPGPEQFRSTASDLFVQDDWRPSSKVTVNLGLRYEYYSPVAEASNRLVTLDVTPAFTAATPVIAGGTGPFNGAFANTIVNPFRTGFAPRTGVAWRVSQTNVLRFGYSINYNSSVYQSIATQLAGQPPFAQAATVTSGLGAPPLNFQNALANLPVGQTTNTYAVDPNYRLPWVQIWNADWQHDITRTIQLGLGYTGTKGSDLDLLRAPNRTPTGLRIADVQPFIWESSSASSIMSAMTVRLRKRMTDGFALGGTYTLSKSIDDASSIAGNGGTVAQNDQDLAAERSLSNFDQRHRFSADFTYQLPFGERKPWFNSGTAAELFGNWAFNGSLSLASGTPLTARVVGNAGNVAQGVNGTLRANYNGEPIAVSDPTTALFFNTAAFSVPAGGTFGDAGRNTIIGPGTSVMNLGLTRNINFGQTTRGLSIQVLASNVFNTVQFATVDTNLNSRTFGQVLSVRPMRKIQIQTRFRF
ncbi:MAG TPA: TonB-dependent receptor [Vicinamibacterales bacterium]|nr:TonB-dependent receptor [Vicinamibacterales bacterium]